MKNIFQFIIIIIFGFFISSCTHKEEIYEGIYNGFNQIRNMEDGDPSTPSDKKFPTYQQYKEERQKVLE